MATLVSIRGLDRSTAAGYSVKRGFRIKNSSGNLVEVTGASNVVVDLDSDLTRKTLARYSGRWVVIPTGGSDSQIYIRSLSSSSAVSQTGSASIVSRGWRVKGVDGNPHAVLPGGSAVQVDVSDAKVRKALAQHRERWIEGNNSNSHVTIRAIQTSSAAVGGGISARGFRIKNSAGAQVDVNGSSSVEVDVSDPYVRRILRRNVGRYVVVSSS